VHRTSDIRMSEDTCTHPRNACKECSRLLKLTIDSRIKRVTETFGSGERRKTIGVVRYIAADTSFFTQ
jgi:hypothetical protein